MTFAYFIGFSDLKIREKLLWHPKDIVDDDPKTEDSRKSMCVRDTTLSSKVVVILKFYR